MLRLVLVACSVLCISACTAFSVRPGSSTAGDSYRKLLASTTIGVVIPDDGGHVVATARRFADKLQQSGVFAQVVLLPNDEADPQIILSNYSGNDLELAQGFQCFEPMLTVLSLGVVPGYCSHKEVSSFVLTGKNGQSVRFEGMTYTHKAVFGWVALPLGVAPGWSFSERRETSNALRAWFESQEQAVRRLLQ
jgi:hypothetical protein